MKTSVVGFPRIGEQRELKFAIEQYFQGDISAEALDAISAALRQKHWQKQKEAGIDYIPSNDFSFYDTVLDTAVLLNIIPARYRRLPLQEIDVYFAMARGYQGESGDVRALAMKKWFNTNYHYIVPEFEDNTEIRLVGEKPFSEYREAKALGIETKPVVLGAYTLLKLLRFTGTKTRRDIVQQTIAAYAQILAKFDAEGTQWVQFDEPSLALDLTPDDKSLYIQLYNGILKDSSKVKVLLQTYFGDIRDCYQETTALAFDGIGLDFVEGRKTSALLQQHGFPQDKILFAGIVNGKNIWKNNYAKTFSVLSDLSKITSKTVISSACSLLHVPYTLEHETGLSTHEKEHFAFAYEKLDELKDISNILSDDAPIRHPLYVKNTTIFSQNRTGENTKVKTRVAGLQNSDFVRSPQLAQREAIQRDKLKLPLLPTSTIGSFPQTADVRANRSQRRQGEISAEAYTVFNKDKIKQCVEHQQKIGLDVLVHGEFERNDMVEYFGEHLDGFLFTQKAWVQS